MPAARRGTSFSFRWELRPISEADFEWAFGLHRDALGEVIDRTWGRDEVDQRRRFADRFNERPRQVIEVDGEPVGVVEVEERRDEIYVAVLELSPAWQGRGLGAEVLGTLLERAKRSGTPLSLHVLQINRRAIRFYEREGLHVAETDPPKLLMRIG